MCLSSLPRGPAKAKAGQHRLPEEEADAFDGVLAIESAPTKFLRTKHSRLRIWYMKQRYKQCPRPMSVLSTWQDGGLFLWRSSERRRLLWPRRVVTACSSGGRSDFKHRRISVFCCSPSPFRRLGLQRTRRRTSRRSYIGVCGMGRPTALGHAFQALVVFPWRVLLCSFD